jgi:hypothetical protein
MTDRIVDHKVDGWPGSAVGEHFSEPGGTLWRRADD